MTDQVDPAHGKTFAAYYQGFLGGRLFRWLDSAKARILSDVLSGCDAGVRAVDLGCGTGNLWQRIRASLPRPDVTYVDHDARLLASAQEKGFTTVVADLNRPLPFTDASFGVVLMADAIEHVECRASTLGEVKRIMRDDGSLVVFTPPYDTVPWLLAERMFRLVMRRQAEHISPFTKESLSWFLQSNFHDWQVGYANFGLTLWGVGKRKKGTGGLCEAHGGSYEQ